MPRLYDSFGWPLGDQTWIGKVIRQSILLVIPVLGQIALLGWLMLNFDNIRSGRWEMAPVGLHLRRGLGPFCVLLSYAIIFGVPALLLSGTAQSLATHSPSGSNLIAFISQIYDLAALALLTFLGPAIVASTWRRGLIGGLDIVTIWRIAMARPGYTVLAGLVVLAAWAIAALGLICILVGALFTTTYSMIIIAGASSWLDRKSQGEEEPAPGPVNP